MSTYVRAFVPGGTFHFTIVTNFRRPILTYSQSLTALREAFEQTRVKYPFDIRAIVVLPDHVHCIWTLPDDDHDFSTRLRIVKARFSRSFLAAGGHETVRSQSRWKHGERGVWHRRFWERTVRDEEEFERICNYIHYNPVAHGHVRCPHAWPHSSFRRFAQDRRYDADWGCTCGGKTFNTRSFEGVDEIVGE